MTSTDNERRDPRAKYVSPGIDQVAFNCPHCGALAKQFWYSVHMDRLEKDKTPTRITVEVVEGLKSENVKKMDEEEKEKQATAEKLFGLVNIIREIMISEPKHVNSLYESLP